MSGDWDESLLKNAFQDQLKLVEQSLGNKKKPTHLSHCSKIYRYESEESTSNTSKANESYEDKSNTAKNITKTKTSDDSASHNQINCLIPPPISPTDLPQINNIDQARASMMMSWYMAGYHTGYYEAMKKFKD